MNPILCLALCSLLSRAWAGHTQIGVGIYDRDPGDARDRSGLSDPYGRNEYDYGYSRGRLAYEDDFRPRYRRREFGGRGDEYRSLRPTRLEGYDRDRSYDRSYDLRHRRDGYDRLDRYDRSRDGYGRGYNRGFGYDRGYERDRYGRDHFRRATAEFGRYPPRGERFDEDRNTFDGYDRYRRQERYRPRGYYNDRYPRDRPGTFFGQTRYPAEQRYDRGYGRPVAGRIDGYEVRKYGWDLGADRNVLNTGYDHGFAGSYQGGYGSAYYSKPSNYIAGAASRLYS